MSKSIRSVIIEDEEKSLLALIKLLSLHCPQVEVVGSARSVVKGTECIKRLKPDLVFLDIELQGGDGFDILERLEKKAFQVIFTTAYNDYAIKAIEFSALHYLLKPIHHSKLIEAVNRFQFNPDANLQNEKIRVLKDNLETKPKRIILTSADEVLVIELKNIVHCEASSNYTYIYLNDGKKLIVSKTLNNLEKLLEDQFFARIHNKHLVNLEYVDKFIKKQPGYVILQDEIKLEVSTRKRNDFLSLLKEFGKSL